MDVIIRAAKAEDSSAIASILNDAILNTTAVFNDVPVDAGEREAWRVARQSAGFPVLVAVQGDEVLGYASYGGYRPFSGFRATVENSVYIAPEARGRGVGKALMAALLDQARKDGHHVMIAGIEPGNAASVRLHAAFGFQQTAILREVGQKFGRWLDLLYMELKLDARPNP